ncbi:uncharacterized protein RJT21DRAFT_117382 [Scheffersomyces amazonensis]|uniref:uncharacterized protein n=1 Tax=Scheffersomyces amazonensis TaxID=1078765 RepID=UPI00315CB067
MQPLDTPTNVTKSINDEDWSIISSSSDIDDDRSTTSEDLTVERDPLNLSINLNQVDQSANNGFAAMSNNFKIPVVRSSTTSRSGSTSTNNTNTNTNNKDRNDSIVTINTVKANDVILSKPEYSDTSSDYDGDVTNSDVSSDESSHSSPIIQPTLFGTYSINNRIKFYENLSKFNESIKQSSNKFYSNYAKSKFQQWNDYIIDSTDSLANSNPNSKSNANEPSDQGENLEDTIELIKHYETLNQKIESSSSDIEPSTSSINSEFPSQPLPVDSTSFYLFNKKYVQPLLLNTLQLIQGFMENNSDYLYYYIFGGILIALIPAFYSLTFIVSSIQSNIAPMFITPKPVPTYPLLSKFEPQFQSHIDHMSKIFEDLLYEDEAPQRVYLFFSKKGPKVSKWSKFIKERDWSEFDLIKKEFSEALEISQQNYNEFSKNFNEFSKSAKVIFDKNYRLGLKYSVVGANKVLSYSEVGAKQVYDFGSKYSEIAFDRALHYTKVGSTELINKSQSLHQFVKDQEIIDKLWKISNDTRSIVEDNFELFKKSSFKQNIDDIAVNIYEKSMDFITDIFGTRDKMPKDLIIIKL